MKEQFIYIDEKGNKHYFFNKEMTKLHREDGPALEWADGYESWWLHGECLSQEEHARRTQKEIVLTPDEVADLEELKRERDEAQTALDEIEKYGTEEINAAVDLRRQLAAALIERDEAREQLAAERELADRLAGVLFGCTATDQNDAYEAWKEARSD